MKTFLIFSLLISYACSSEKKGHQALKESSTKYQVEKVYEGEGVLWSFSFLSQNEVFVAHRDGELFHFNLKTKKKKKLKAPKVWSNGQGGLLDTLYHKENLYITYSKTNPKGKAVTALAKAAWKNGELKEPKDIFVSNADGDGGIHFGSRLVVRKREGGDELFMTVGDRGERDKAQSLAYHNGKVLRLTLEGKPYPGNPYMNKDGLDEIYSYGHRNPQGIDIYEGKVYVAEMGPRGGDEVNISQKGKNFGWPEVTYGTEYYGPKIGQEKKAGMAQPLTYWVPSISPSGIAFYTGDKIKEWKGDLFLGCLSGTQVRMVEIEDGKVGPQKELFYDMEERFRSVEDGPDGALYLSTDSGKIFRVSKQ